jgi:hypothetical protein
MQKKSNQQPAKHPKTHPEESRSQNLAKLTLNPAYRSAAVITKFDSNQNVDFWDLTLEVKTQATALQTGDMENAVSMLSTQAIALDCLFSNLSRRACGNMEEGFGEAAERYMKLAMRAQAQCAKTIQTMGELKNPRHIAFVRQANIAHNQQVNNQELPCTKKDRFQQNKLIDGDKDDLQMDARTENSAGGIDQKMEAVGEINRP